MDDLVIETQRLVLRPVTLVDLAAVASAWRLDEAPISIEDARQKIEWMQGNHAQNRRGRVVHLCLAIFEKNNQELIGWCGLDHRDGAKPNPVLFYLLKERWWGKGLATEAARALLKYAFTVLELPRIDSGAAIENLASKRVMEKLDMRYLGLNAEGGYSFTISKDDFLQAKPPD